MGDKIKGLTGLNKQLTTYVFWCPGCNDVHPYRVARDGDEEAKAPVWSFNGSLDRPTFSPSLLVNSYGQGRRCHLFLTDGQLNFCGDSQHELAGKTVPCPDWDDERW